MPLSRIRSSRACSFIQDARLDDKSDDGIDAGQRSSLFDGRILLLNSKTR